MRKIINRVKSKLSGKNRKTSPMTPKAGIGKHRYARGGKVKRKSC